MYDDKEISASGKCVLCRKTFTPGCPTCQNILEYRRRLCEISNAEAMTNEKETESAFPGLGLVKRDEIYGNYVVASRKIEAGELICVERPLLVSPYGPSDLIPLCLSCCKDLSFSQKCTQCQWPICDLNCQMNPSHRENECEIFMRNGLKPKNVVNEYFSVETLRCLLLREKCESKWEAVKRFESHLKSRREDIMAQQTLQFITKFIREQCKLTQFDVSTIDLVVGVLSVNTFWAFKDLNRYTSVLFDKVTLFAHDCDPNTKRELIILDEEEDLNGNKNDSDIGIKITASETIETGEMITIRYIDISQPLKQRRRELKDTFYFDCCCNKCLRQMIEEHSNDNIALPEIILDLSLSNLIL